MRGGSETGRCAEYNTESLKRVMVRLQIGRFT